MRWKKNRQQQQAPAGPAVAWLSELVAKFRAQGISEADALPEHATLWPVPGLY